MRSPTTSSARATLDACAWSASSRSSDSPRRGRGAASSSKRARQRRSPMAPSRSSWRARRPASSCPSAAERASATPASESSVPGRYGTFVTEKSTATEARWCGPASTRLRGTWRSNYETGGTTGMTPTDTESPLAHLSDQQIEELGREFDALHDEIYGDLGDRDRRYITSMIDMQRRLAVLGRVLLLGSRFRPAWAAGMSALASAKILENMEIGHNVLHGQWDWMNDPQIHSSTWDWDTASTSEAWKHSHNYIHHTYTNILGKDKDLGYEIMRIDPQQGWHPVYLLQPFYNALLMALFEWGVAFHDLDLEALRKGEKSKEQLAKELKGIAGKARTQITKDYIAWPLVSALGSAAALVATELVREQRRDGLRDRAARRLRRRGRAGELARAALR